MEELCTACMCAGRNLYLLTEANLNSIYEQILNEISDSQCGLRVSVHVCWECRALLRRFQRFRVQVKSCYRELVQYLEQDPSSIPRARQPRLQLHHAQSTSVPEPVKEESDLLVDLKSEKEELHEEPETVALAFNMDKDSCSEEKGQVVKIKKDKQTLKKKVKKKVKLKKSKNKKKKSENSIADISDLSDREGVEVYGDKESAEDGCDLDEVYSDVKSENAQRQENGVKKRQPRSKEVLPEKPTCADCGKTFSSKKTYRYHRNVLHRGQNRYPCPRCGRVYQWKSNLGRHMRTHKAIDTGELYCEKCDKTFASVATYRQHLRISRRHVPESDYTFMCNECGKKFVDKTRLRDHIDWEHLKKVKYRCQICNNAFKCHTTLYVHTQNIHTNKEKKENLCHVCGKSYQNASKLKYHIVAMHTSETPHRCSQCGAAFGWYSSLYRHVREVHYGMKVPAKNVKKSKKLLRDLLMHPHENPLAQTGPS